MMQEPNISDVVETETLGPRPGQIFETDTSSKNPRLENRKFVDYADIFLQIFKKYCRDYEVAIFSNFWHLVISYLQIQQTKNTLVLLSHIFAVLKASNECACDRDQDKTSNLRDWDSKNGKSRDQEQISRLHHCLTRSRETSILCSTCNVHLCLNQWWSLETHFCESWSWRFQVSSQSRTDLETLNIAIQWFFVCCICR